MTKVYGTGIYDFRRHRVAEYPVAEPKAVEWSQKGGSGGLPSTITVSEIQRDRPYQDCRGELVEKRATSPFLCRGWMILEVSQYLENYLWPHFDPLTATFEHVMSIILMVNEKFRENVAAWACFHDRKDVFKGFLERVLRLKE
ncbi:Intron-binding protein aquarius, N-terminal, partial [Sesbania bispinosa]